MLAKAAENCVKNLTTKGITPSNIVVQTRTVVLNTVRLQSARVDCACQVDMRKLCSEDWFEKFMEGIEIKEVETDTTSTESEDDDLLFDQINIVVEAIKSVHFDWPQCPTQRLQNHLQGNGLKLEVLEANPIFFKAFKQKLYKEFRYSFPEYSSLLQCVDIHNFPWQVMYLWEFLVNTQTDENTYEWLKILIDK